MKNGAACPKCQGKNILYVPGGLLQEQNKSVMGPFFGTTFRIARYVCVDCGFSEEWVDKPDDMAKVRRLAGNS